MSHLPPFLRCFCLTGAFAITSFIGNLHAEQVLIDTDFALVAADGSLQTAGKVTNVSQLPLKAPTRAVAVALSTLKAATEPLGEMKPPYALINLGTSETNPDITGNSSLQWDLRGVPLESGRFKLTYQIASLATGIPGGRLYVILQDATGKGISAHPTQWPIQVFFNKERLQATHQDPGVPYVETQVINVEITFDLDKKIWSAKADGQPLATDLPFADPYQQAGPLRIATVDLGAGGNTGDTGGSGYAIARMKLVKLD